MANVRDFGAAGDGTTDDTQALRHALAEGDGVLQLEKATYRITETLVVDTTRTGYAAVLGRGGTSRIVMAGPGPALRIVGDHQGTAQPDSVRPQTWQRERFPTVSGLEIAGAHPLADGIELCRTLQATITQVLVRRCRYAIHLVERNRNFVLADSHLYDNSQYGLFFDHCNLHQVIVVGNHISYNRVAGIKSLNGDVHNVQITGNDIEYNNDPESDAADDGTPRAADVWLEAPRGVISEVTLASNTIQATVQPGGANVRVQGSEENSPRGARLIAIMGNVLGSQRRGIELSHAQRVAVTGNTIYDSRDLSLAAYHCSGLSVGANTFVWRGLASDPPSDGIWLEDCDNALLDGLVTERLCSGTPERGGGITLVRCRDSAVANCQVLDPLHRGIELEDCHRCRVSDNSILERRDEPSMHEAIRVSGTGKGNLVQNNLVSGGLAEAIRIAPGSANVQGNTVV